MNEHDNLGGTGNDTLDHQTIETEIVKTGTKDDCSIIIKWGIGITEHYGTQGQGNVSYLLKNTRKFQANSKQNSLKATSKLKQCQCFQH